jgi:hypothetical protein
MCQQHVHVGFVNVSNHRLVQKCKPNQCRNGKFIRLLCSICVEFQRITANLVQQPRPTYHEMSHLYVTSEGDISKFFMNTWREWANGIHGNLLEVMRYIYRRQLCLLIKALEHTTISDGYIPNIYIAYCHCVWIASCVWSMSKLHVAKIQVYLDRIVSCLSRQCPMIKVGVIVEVL